MRDCCCSPLSPSRLRSGTRACLQSSLDPKDGGHNIDHGGEARIRFFVACGEASKPFHFTEEILDQMTPLIFLAVMRGMPVRSFTKWYNSLDVIARQAFAKPVRIERLVSDERQTVNASHKSIEARNVVPIAWQQNETDQIAERIDDDGNLRGPTAARFANRLFLSPPFAPVPC